MLFFDIAVSSEPPGRARDRSAPSPATRTPPSRSPRQPRPRALASSPPGPAQPSAATTSTSTALEHSRRRDMSLFKKKAATRKLSFGPDPSTSSLPSSSALDPPPLLASPPPSPYEASLHIDDFGRPITQPAFAAAGRGGSPRFGDGYGVGDDLEPAQPAEMQLLYGYAPIATTLELSIVKLDKVVAACADEIRRREWVSSCGGGSSSSLAAWLADSSSYARRRTRHAPHHVEHGPRHLARRRLLPHPLVPRRSGRLGSRCGLSRLCFSLTSSSRLRPDAATYRPQLGAPALGRRLHEVGPGSPRQRARSARLPVGCCVRYFPVCRARCGPSRSSQPAVPS